MDGEKPKTRHFTLIPPFLSGDLSSPREIHTTRGRKGTDPPPPFYGVQGVGAPDQKAVEGHREGQWVEAPQGTLGEVAVQGEVYEGGVGFPRQYEGELYQY